MMYAEASYFDGYHFQHIAAWEDYKRLQRIQRQLFVMRERRSRPR